MINRAMCTAYLSEMFEDVIDDDLLGLVGVHSGEWVHVDDSIFKSNQRKSQGAFQSLWRQKNIHVKKKQITHEQEVTG